MGCFEELDRDMDLVRYLFEFIENEEIDTYQDLVEHLVHYYAKVTKPDVPDMELPFDEWHKVLIKYTSHFRAYFEA